LVIHVATNAQVLIEPMLFYIAFAGRPDALPAATRQPLEHAVGFREIMRVRWIRPDITPVSAELQALVQAGHMSLDSGDEHLLEVAFDEESHGRRADFRPELPLVFCW
jgi:hypothetical protein